MDVKGHRLPLPNVAVYALLQLFTLTLAWWMWARGGDCPGRGSLPLIVKGPWGARASFPAEGSLPSSVARQSHTQALDGLRIAEGCQDGDAQQLASAFVKYSSASPNHTACPSKAWLLKLQEVAPGASDFLVVGCQHGYASAAIFGLWAPKLGISPSTLHRAADDLPCGPCDECREELPPGPGSHLKASLRVVCVEPHPAAYARLESLHQHLFAKAQPGMQWQVMHAGVGSSGSGTPVVMRCSAAERSCRLANATSAAGDPLHSLVPVVTVDEVLDLAAMQTVDMLQIDVGGDEVHALGGALGALSNGRVGVLALAYGGDGAWQEGWLGQLVARMDELGHTCYLAGQQTRDGSLARLTGCWAAVYETLAPSTVVCVPRSHPLYPHTERLSLRYALHQQQYFSHDGALVQAETAGDEPAQPAGGGKPDEEAKQPSEAEQPAKGKAPAVAQTVEGQPAAKQVAEQQPKQQQQQQQQQGDDPPNQPDKQEAAGSPAQPSPGTVAQPEVLLTAEQQKRLVVAGRGVPSKIDPQPDSLLTAKQQEELDEERRQAVRKLPVTHNLTAWALSPDDFVFRDKQSGCLLYPDGTAEAHEGWEQDERQPFLFDTQSMPGREAACAGCPANEKPPLCCGVCIFEDRRCEQHYPGKKKSEWAAQHLLRAGYQLRAFTPCELFQRLRGRTLWFMGDSQTWHFYYSAECFLRSFAPSLRRAPPVPWALNQQLITVTWPVKVPPICLELALGTRVCAVRVDSAATLMSKVLPLLHHNTPHFDSGIMVFNEGLHYGTPGADGRPANQSDLYREMERFVGYKQRYGHAMPKVVWVDSSVQHFDGPDGSYPGGKPPFSCKPLAAWERGDALVVGGGRRNMPLAPLIPRFADAHLRTWNASVPFWDSHKPGECTHWCSPSAYHAWLYLLNDVLRDAGLGNAAHVAERPSMAAAAAAAAGAA